MDEMNAHIRYLRRLQQKLGQRDAEWLESIIKIVRYSEWAGRTSANNDLTESCPICNGIKPDCKWSQCFWEAARGHRPGYPYRKGNR